MEGNKSECRRGNKEGAWRGRSSSSCRSPRPRSATRSVGGSLGLKIYFKNILVEGHDAGTCVHGLMGTESGAESFVGDIVARGGRAAVRGYCVGELSPYSLL